MTKDRWYALMAAWGFELNDDAFDSLFMAYSRQERYYHTAEHISACLRHMDRFISEIAVPRELEISLWFHDAVYKPLSTKNELESADWSVSFLSKNGATNEEVDRVRRLILVTKHNMPILTKDEAILVDIDLSILGASPATYEKFESAVRSEYKVIPYFIYRKKRANLLRDFLKRDKIYTSGCFSKEFEAQARSNLANAIKHLEARA